MLDLDDSDPVNRRANPTHPKTIQCPECRTWTMKHFMGEQWVCEDCDVEITAFFATPSLAEALRLKSVWNN